MTLRWRFTAFVAGLLAVLLVGAGLLLSRVEHRLAEEGLEDRLEEMLRREEALFPQLRESRTAPLTATLTPLVAGDRRAVIYFSPLGPPQPDPGPPVLLAHASTDGDALQLLEASGMSPSFDRRQFFDELVVGGHAYSVLVLPPRSQSPPPPLNTRAPPPIGGPPPPGPWHGDRGWEPGRPGGAPRLAVAGVAFLGRRSALAALDRRLVRNAWVGLLVWVLGTALGFVLAGRMLRPIRAAADAAEQVEQATQRLPHPKSEDELGRLVLVLNKMLGRLEEVSEREHSFLATASHELRRPLASLTGELELALRGERSTAELREAIELTLGDARTMNELVDNLLLHARARAVGLTLREADIDIVTLLADAIERSERFLSGNAFIELLEGRPFTLRGDPRLLGSVFENLLVNAGTHGGRDVKVKAGWQLHESKIEIFVEDDGEGISASDLGLIFEPFGRGDQTRSVSGKGLGLAIAKEVVCAHGGTIAARSLDGGEGGTRFLVTLPGDRIVKAPTVGASGRRT